jgi:hypothetical protein
MMHTRANPDSICALPTRRTSGSIQVDVRIRGRELQRDSVVGEAHRDAGLPLREPLDPREGTVASKAHSLRRRFRERLLPAERVNLLHRSAGSDDDFKRTLPRNLSCGAMG